MEEKKHTGWWILGVIAVVAGIALAVTNAVTEGPIQQRGEALANEAVRNLLPDADRYEALETTPSNGLDAAYTGLKGEMAVGYAAQTTVQGYAGPIEIILGMNPQGMLSGISVGGSEFKETEGLGSKTKDAAFTDQFKGKTVPLTLGSDVEAVSGATVSSRAVTQGVNAAAASLTALAGLTLDLPTESPTAAATNVPTATTLPPETTAGMPEASAAPAQE